MNQLLRSGRHISEKRVLGLIHFSSVRAAFFPSQYGGSKLFSRSNRIQGYDG
jgi:hypothetical protein